jgi:predicted PolB exonuclease-like 3'-5' exonuclease
MLKLFHDEVWAFDAEWVPDSRSGRRAYSLPADMPDAEVLAHMWREGGATEENPRPFLKTVLCRVVSIAAVIRKREAGRTVSITLISQPREPKLDATEGEIISGFLTGVGNSKPQLVGFSSHSSDLPALIQRALVNRLNLPGFCARPNKPWEGPDYFARGSDYNIDLKEELAGWGKATPSLHEVATACGIPGKIGTDGGDVVGLWRAGDVRKIVQYNECDALTTYLLWLRVALLAGHLTQEQHEVGEHEIRTLLEARSAGGVNGHLTAYLAVWDSLRKA